MKKLLLFVLITLSASLAGAQGIAYSGQITNSQGIGLPDVTVNVFTITTTGNPAVVNCVNPVTVYKDIALAQPYTVLQTNGFGSYYFFTAAVPIGSNLGYQVSGGITADTNCYPFPSATGPGGTVGPSGYQSIAACYAAISSGQTCFVSPGWVDPMWTANLVINKNFTSIQFQGSAFVPMGAFQLQVVDGTVGFSITSPFVYGATQNGTSNPPTGAVQFVYTGSGVAMPIGTNAGGGGARSIRLENFALNLAGAGNSSVGIDMYAVGNLVANNVSVIAPSGCANSQIGWRLNNNGSGQDSEGNHFYNIKAGHSIAFQNNNNTIDDFYNLGFTAGGCSSYVGFDNEGSGVSAIHVFGGLISGYGTSVKCNSCSNSTFEVETESGLFPLPDITLSSGSNNITAILTGSVAKSSSDAGANNLVSSPGNACVSGCTGTGKTVHASSPALLSPMITGIDNGSETLVNKTLDTAAPNTLRINGTTITGITGTTPTLASSSAAMAYQFGCGGTASASATILLNTFNNAGNTTQCNFASSPGGTEIITSPGIVKNLFVNTSTGGVNSNSGVFTVIQCPGGTSCATTAITCTLGTGHACNDTTHSIAVAAGDTIKVQFTTQAAETITHVAAGLEKN
jgi:hypothetical protein